MGGIITAWSCSDWFKAVPLLKAIVGIWLWPEEKKAIPLVNISINTGFLNWSHWLILDMSCQQTWREFSHLALWVAIFMYYREMLVVFIYTAPQICQWAEPCQPQHQPCALWQKAHHSPAKVLLTTGKCKGAFATSCMELITLWASQANGNCIYVLRRVCKKLS